MKNILIIKCGETFPGIKEKYGDFEDWIIAQSNLPKNVFKIYNLPEGDQLRHPSEFIAAIITGSHSNVDQKLDWIKQLKNWIVTARYSNIPVLGICFGHQIIAEALGGSVQLNEEGTISGVSNISLTKEGQNDPLFKNTALTFESYSSHSYEVASLPLGASLLATGNDKMVESFKVEKIYGVQFHPEFNAQIMEEYIKNSENGTSSKTRVKNKYEIINEQIVPNFLDICLKF
jgi:GMP synthase (glutamine-hydrolysing)